MKLPKPIQQALQKLAQSIIPTRLSNAPNERFDPPSPLAYLDADTMAGILQEAEDGYVERLMMLYRDIMVDAHLLGEFQKRKLAVLKEIPTFTAEDTDDPACVLACDAVDAMWSGLKGKREAITHLLDSTLYPVAIIEKKFRASSKPGLRFELDRLVPVPHHLLDYREGFLRIRDIAADGRPLDTWHRPSNNRYIIHRGHLLTSFPDKWGGPMRAVVFWWLFKTMNRDWWARFLDRFGAPFLVGTYEDGDERSRAELAQAFNKATKIFGLTIPTGTSVQLVQSSAASTGDAFAKFHDVANAEISKLIVGQTMTTESQAAGLGSGQAQVHQGVRDDIAAFDGMALAETLRDDLFDQFLQINGLFGSRPTVSFGGQAQADAKATAELLRSLREAGWEPSEEAEEHLSRIVGFPVFRVVAQDPSLTLSVGDANLELAATSAAGVSRALRQHHAATRRAIAESTSPEDLHDRLVTLLESRENPAVNAIADVLASYGVNALRS